MLLRLFALAAMCAGLAGCDAVQTALQSPAEKVNAAFPLPEETVTARNALFKAVQEQDAKAHQELSAQLERQLELRALACSSTASIGRFDSADTVRRKVGSPTCFHEQDAKLADWIGVHRVIRALRKPPLVPLAPLPARLLLPAQREAAADLAIAESANVVAMRSVRQPVTVLGLPGPKVLGALDAPPDSSGAGNLSPNGAVLAVSGGGRITFFDAATGNTLWKSDKHRQVLAWLPEVDATLLAGPDASPVLLDHQKASLDTYPASQRVDWTARLPGNTGRLVLGSGSQVTLAEHARAADGSLTAQPVKQWRLERGVTSGRPMLLRQGRKLLYVNGNDLGWLDLENGEQGMWELRAVGGGSYAKLSETQVYLETAGPVNAWQRVPYILDVEKATLAPAEQDGNEGVVIPLTPRAGYARRGNGSSISIFSGATAKGEEKPLQGVIAEAQLARELAKVAAAQAQAAAEAQVRAEYAGSRMPGSAVDTMARMRGESAAREAAAAAAARPPSAPPLLAGIPADARVAVVGVYESAAGKHGTRGERTAGAVRVTVGPGRGPLVLVLTSYEPVNWIVQDGGRPPAAILLSSYYPSTVAGTQAQVHRIGSRHAYQMGSAEYLILKQDIARYVAAPVASFQGVYSGTEFSVY